MRSYIGIWKKTVAHFIWIAALIVVPGHDPVLAQVVNGSVSGTVTDHTGAVIPNTKITITSKDTNAVKMAATDSHGFYSVQDLAPGDYVITGSADGFDQFESSDVPLTIGARLIINMTLTVGRTTQTVVVAGTTSGVDLQSSTLNTVVSDTTLVELPLNGRSWIDLANLQPGVSATMQLPNGSPGKGSRGVGSQVGISGGRPDENNYRLDGISINDFANGSPGGMTGGALGVDAIEEFSVLTGNYSAEYGRASGGIFNALTRSGSNKLHGSAYEFLRNSALDARNYFDGHVIPPFKRNQFGGSAGGPIRKDKTFAFGDYEGLRQSLGSTYVDNVPSPSARAGNLSTGSVTVNPGVAAIILAFYPLPNGPLNSTGDTGKYSFPVQSITTEDFWTAKLDQNFSAKDRLSGIYLWDNSYTSEPDPLNIRLVESTASRQMITLQESHTFTAELLNSFRIGYSRSLGNMSRTSTAINTNVTNLALGSDPGRTVAQFSAPGITKMPGGIGSQTNFVFHYNSLQVYDDLFFTHGIHSIKIGASFESLQDIMSGASDADGLATFGSLAGFLEGTPTSYLAGVAVPQNERHIHESIWGAYVQDDIRLRKNLTANLGVRYEMATVPTEANGLLSTLVDYTSAAPPHLGSPYFSNPSKLDFEPRAGLVWDPFGTGKTSVRSGFGIYDMLILPYQIQQNALFSYPYYEVFSGANLPAGSFPYSVYQDVSANPGTYPFRYGYIQQHPKPSYAMQWNLNVQRDLPLRLTGTIDYVGSRGLHEPYQDADMNIVLPTSSPQGYEWPTPKGSGTRLNTNFSDISSTMWISQSTFNALELELMRNLSKGLQIQGSYTWGKVFDDSSGSIAADQFANSQSSSPPWWNPRVGRGVADFNVTRNLIINGVWDVPVPNSVPRFEGGVLKGWELSGIYKADSGLPFTVGIAGDPLGEDSTDPYDYPDRVNTPGCHVLTNPGNAAQYVKTQCLAFPNPSTRLGNLPRNSFVGPGLSNLDFSVFKNNTVRDTVHFQFRAEIFNILNRTNFAPPIDNSTAFQSNGSPVANVGLIDQTLVPSRQIQFGLKITW